MPDADWNTQPNAIHGMTWDDMGNAVAQLDNLAVLLASMHKLYPLNCHVKVEVIK